MNYEEKRQAYLAISQLFADAGLNQHTIKEMVEKEVYNKVNREVKNIIQGLNEQCYSGNYIEEQIRKRIASDYVNKYQQLAHERFDSNEDMYGNWD